MIYYLPDRRKEGGACVTMTGRLKRVDEAFQELLFTDGTRIPAKDNFGDMRNRFRIS